MLAVPLDDRQFGACRALMALTTGNPGAVIFHQTVQRPHLAQVAALIRRRAPQRAFGVFQGRLGFVGLEVDDVGQAQALRQLIAILQGLEEVAVGVEKQHRQVRVDLGDHVQQHGGIGAERRRQGDVAEELVADGVTQDILRRQAFVLGTELFGAQGVFRTLVILQNIDQDRHDYNP